MGFAFPKECREAALEAEPEKFVRPKTGDLRYNWLVVRLAAIDGDEMAELVTDAWSMVVPRAGGRRVPGEWVPVTALFEGFEAHGRLLLRAGRVRARVGGERAAAAAAARLPADASDVARRRTGCSRRAFTVVAADLPRLRRLLPPARRRGPRRPRQARARRGSGGRDGAGSATRRFAVAGHDRGGRVAYRMALDHPGVLTRLAVLDIVPTGEIWRGRRRRVRARLLALGIPSQPAPLPERLILGDPGRLLARDRADGDQARRRALPRRRSSRPTARSSTTRRTVDGDVRGLPRGRDDRPRARRRRPRHAHDRLPGARAVGRRGRAAALLRGPARAVARRYAPGDHRPRGRGRVALPRRGRARRGRGRPRRVLRRRARRPAASRSASIPPRERASTRRPSGRGGRSRRGRAACPRRARSASTSSTNSSTRPSSMQAAARASGCPRRAGSARLAQLADRARTGPRRGSSSCSSRRVSSVVETTYLGIELNLSENGSPERDGHAAAKPS